MSDHTPLPPLDPTQPVRHETTVDASIDEALEAVDDAAELWGAEWQRHGNGGRLLLPVSAGIRHGLLDGQVSISGSPPERRLVFAAERGRYRVNVASLFVLLLGAASGLFILIAPLIALRDGHEAAIFQLLPVAVLLIVTAWLLVLARLRDRGGEEFLQMVREFAEEPPEGVMEGLRLEDAAAQDTAVDERETSSSERRGE